LLVLLAPLLDEVGNSPWTGLRQPIIRELGRYERDGLITVQWAERSAHWPYPGLYWNDLYGIPTLLVEVGLDQQTFDVRLGGCHLVSGASSPVTPVDGGMAGHH
jgi:hypothetical protein